MDSRLETVAQSFLDRSWSKTRSPERDPGQPRSLLTFSWPPVHLRRVRGDVKNGRVFEVHGETWLQLPSVLKSITMIHLDLLRHWQRNLDSEKLNLCQFVVSFVQNGFYFNEWRVNVFELGFIFEEPIIYHCIHYHLQGSNKAARRAISTSLNTATFKTFDSKAWLNILQRSVDSVIKVHDFLR